MKHLFILFSFIFTCSFGQTKETKKPLESLSSDVKTILDSLHSYSASDKTSLQFKFIGEASKISRLFLIYAELTKKASESELLKILDDTKEKSFIRGYAYMAYVYKCDSEKKKEKPLNYNFTVWVENGCVTRPYVFSQFKEKMHSPRRYYDPNPGKKVIDTEEAAAINEGNKIREEQGETLRKQ